MCIEEAGRVHLPRRADPVQRKGQRRPAGLRAQFFLAYVVGPAAPAFADAAAHHQHVDHAAVVHVTVVPVVHAGADDYHRATFCLVGVVGELPRHGDHLIAWHTGDLLLPGRCVRRVVVEVGSGELARQSARDAVLRHLQVEHGGHQRRALFARLAQRDALHRHRAHQHITLLVVGKVLVVNAAKVRKANLRAVMDGCAFHHRELERDLSAVTRFLGLQVPLAGIGAAVRAPAKADGALRQHHLAALVECHGFPLGVVGLAELAVEVRGPHIAVGHHDGVAAGQHMLFEHDQHRQVGVAACVVVKVSRARLAVAAEVIVFQDHMAHGHGECGVGALLGVQPDVRQLGHLGVVGRDRHGLGALVPDFGEEVSVRRACLRHIRAPRDDEARVVPVGRFGHVGLLSPDLRAGGRQVAVPVVKTHADAADQGQVA